MAGPSRTSITLHGLAFATWKERQLRSKTNRGGRPKKGQPTANEKLMAYVANHQDKGAYTSTKFAAILGYARSTIEATPAWNKLKEVRAMEKLQRRERDKDKYI